MTLHTPTASPDSFAHASPQSFTQGKAAPLRVMVSKAHAVHNVLQCLIFGSGFSFAMSNKDWTEYLLDEIFYDSQLAQRLLACILGNYPDEFRAVQESVDELIYNKAMKQLAKMSVQDLRKEGLA